MLFPFWFHLSSTLCIITCITLTKKKNLVSYFIEKGAPGRKYEPSSSREGTPYVSSWLSWMSALQLSICWLVTEPTGFLGSSMRLMMA